MKVSELIEKLKTCDPDANVVMVTQPNYPMLHEVARATTAEHLDEEIDRLPKSTVFLCEGTWVGYGDRDIWQ